MLEMLPVEIPLNIRPNATAGLAIAPVTVKVPAANTQVATAIQIRFACLLFTNVPIMKTKPAVASSSPRKIGAETWFPSVSGEIVFSQSARPAATPKNAPASWAIT